MFGLNLAQFGGLAVGTALPLAGGVALGIVARRAAYGTDFIAANWWFKLGYDVVATFVGLAVAVRTGGLVRNVALGFAAYGSISVVQQVLFRFTGKDWIPRAQGITGADG